MVANDGYFGFFLQQLVSQSPVLLVHLVGLIVSIVWLRRATAPAMLCMFGCGLTIVAALLFTGLNSWLVQRRMQGDPREEAMNWMMLASIVSSLLRAIGAALIISAVFVLRTPAPLPRSAHRDDYPTPIIPPTPSSFPSTDHPEAVRRTLNRDGS